MVASRFAASANATPTATTGTAVSDGYFLMLKPLSGGTHTVRCGGTFHFSVAEGEPFEGDFGFGNIKAQDGFQGVDKSPSLQGDLPCLGHLFARGQGAILVS